MVRANALKNKVTAKYTAELPATVSQAKFEVIQTDTQDDANAALLRVNSGEDWATVAKAVSKESDVATTGGLHDYTAVEPRRRVVREFHNDGGRGGHERSASEQQRHGLLRRAPRRPIGPAGEGQRQASAGEQEVQRLADEHRADDDRVPRLGHAGAERRSGWVASNILPKVRAQQISQQATQVAASSAAATAQALQPTPGTPESQPTAAPTVRRPDDPGGPESARGARQWAVTARAIGIGLMGLGVVGSGVARILQEKADVYARQIGCRSCCGACSCAIRRRSATSTSTGAAHDRRRRVCSTIPTIELIIEVMGGEEPAYDVPARRARAPTSSSSPRTRR